MLYYSLKQQREGARCKKIFILKKQFNIDGNPKNINGLKAKNVKKKSGLQQLLLIGSKNMAIPGN